MLSAPDGADLTDRTILFIDDDQDALVALCTLCEAEGMQTVTARNLLTALTKVVQCQPDVVCVDLNMPTGNGLEFCKSLAGDASTASIPRILLTGSPTSAALRVSSEICSAVIRKGPQMWPALKTEMRRLLRQAAGALPPGHDRQKTVVVADDDEDIRDLLTKRFEGLGCRVLQASTSLEALHVIEGSLPDLVCIDVDMPMGSGLSAAELVSADSRLNTIPMIVLTGRTDPVTIRRCHEMMAYYVPKNADVWSRIEPLVTDELDLPYRDASGDSDRSSHSLSSVSPGDDRVEHTRR